MKTNKNNKSISTVSVPTEALTFKGYLRYIGIPEGKVLSREERAQLNADLNAARAVYAKAHKVSVSIGGRALAMETVTERYVGCDAIGLPTHKRVTIRTAKAELTHAEKLAHAEALSRKLAAFIAG
jgi:hypothetical protein